MSAIPGWPDGSYLSEYAARQAALAWAQEKGIAEPAVGQCNKNLGGSWIVMITSGGIPVSKVVVSDTGEETLNVKDIG